MKCSHCGWSGMANYCPECGSRLVPDRDVEDEMIRKVEESLATEVEEERAQAVYEKTVQLPQIRRIIEEEPEEEYSEAYEDDDEDEYVEKYDREYEEEDEEEEDDDDEDDDEEIYEDRRVREQDRRPTRLGSALNRGFHRIWDLICTALRLSSAVLMLAVAFALAWGFLGSRPRGGFPDLHHLTKDPMGVYLVGALALVVFAAIQTLWILTRSRVRTGGGVEYRDKGHGITGFLLYALLSVGAEPVMLFLPDGDRAVFTGVRHIMTAVHSLGDVFLGLVFLGLILCVLRRICGAERI